MCFTSTMFSVKLKSIGNFLRLEVVGRAGETQLQVGEKLNKMT